eukprot:3207896-Pleurochrysis_carterae.AAC.2
MASVGLVRSRIPVFPCQGNLLAKELIAIKAALQADTAALQADAARQRHLWVDTRSSDTRRFDRQAVCEPGVYAQRLVVQPHAKGAFDPAEGLVQAAERVTPALVLFRKTPRDAGVAQQPAALLYKVKDAEVGLFESGGHDGKGTFARVARVERVGSPDRDGRQRVREEVVRAHAHNE